MFRARLHARLACRQCRARKKKCDERRPHCGSCRRWRLPCAYPEEVNTLVHRVSSGYSPLHSQRQLFLLTQSAAIIRRNMRPIAAQRAGDLAILVTVALQEEWLRDLLVAYAELIHSSSSQSSQVAPLNAYARSCAGFRQYIAVQARQSESVGMIGLIACTFLGLFEVRYSEQPIFSLVHFTAAATILVNLQSAHYINGSSLDGFQDFMRIAAEFCLYYLSSFMQLDVRFDTVLRHLDLDVFRSIIVPHSSSYLRLHEISPFMGGNHEVCLLNMQVTLFIREHHHQTTRRQTAQRFIAKTQALELDCLRYYRGLSTLEGSQNTRVALMFCASLRITLQKVVDVNIRASHPLIQHDVRAATDLLFRSGSQVYDDMGLYWPIFVLLCATTLQDSGMIRSLSKHLADITAVSVAGHKAWQTTVMKRFEEYHSAAVRDLAGPEDCLDLLLHPITLTQT